MEESVVIGSSNNKLFCVFLLIFILLNSFGNLISEAQLLPEDEVQTLQQISTKLKNVHWTITQSSCNRDGDFNKIIRSGNSNVTCDCSFNSSTVCHVTNILLNSLNLTGVLPEEFANLTYLREIDLTCNYLNGSIPASWARLPLAILSLLGNRISGPIPKEIGGIVTLTDLVLENNDLSGSLPPELGNLSLLSRLLLSANNFTGTLPDNFVNLRNLTDLIDGNAISGRLPDFIGNWTHLKRLDMQGTSMEGPLTSISHLTNLTDLRVTDLKGSNISFPDLRELKGMENLVLRNCSIEGKIPDSFEGMTKLKSLDLSFNRLTGEIPGTLQGLSSLQYMYLTNNSLSGAIPGWVYGKKQKFDLSYNNFSENPPFN